MRCRKPYLGFLRGGRGFWVEAVDLSKFEIALHRAAGLYIHMYPTLHTRARQPQTLATFVPHFVRE